MTRAYYNEVEPYCIDWLRNLMRDNLIAPGDVDTRDIRDVVPNDLAGYTQYHFFAGIGGWSYALRSAGWPDHREVWTGSCPCQPFSQAGKRLGFADDRHLWPFWRYLIAVRRPAVVYGEQVASAAEWLRLVRGDLEALGYPFRCIPVEAASAGADHLRDRYWFMAHDEHAREGRRRVQRSRESSPAAGERAPDQSAGAGSNSGRLADARGGRRSEPYQGEDQFEGRAQTFGAGNGVGLADAHGARLPERVGNPLFQREAVEPSQGQTFERDGVAHSDFFFESDRELQRGREFGGVGGDQEARLGSDLGYAARDGERRERERERGSGRGSTSPLGGPSTDYEWVAGADGKARRVKPGIRLLAHGIPNRIPQLRAFGNAIDPRPAAAFIRATM